jgi:hypothetical protein
METILAKNVVVCYIVYKGYLLYNQLNDDSNQITVTDLIKFVENLDQSDKTMYCEKFFTLASHNK